MIRADSESASQSNLRNRFFPASTGTYPSRVTLSLIPEAS